MFGAERRVFIIASGRGQERFKQGQKSAQKLVYQGIEVIVHSGEKLESQAAQITAGIISPGKRETNRCLQRKLKQETSDQYRLRLEKALVRSLSLTRGDLVIVASPSVVKTILTNSVYFNRPQRRYSGEVYLMHEAAPRNGSLPLTFDSKMRYSVNPLPTGLK